MSSTTQAARPTPPLSRKSSAETKASTEKPSAFKRRWMLLSMLGLSSTTATVSARPANALPFQTVDRRMTTSGLHSQ